MTIRIFTTGGTFDKIYFDAASEFHIGEPMAGALLDEANVSFDYEIVSLLKKDSLDMDDADREIIRNAIANVPGEWILLTHGTDSMVATAKALLDISGKTIVIFGAMQPARMRFSDAMYNLGFASAAVQLLPHGVHLAMNGQIFDPRKVSKNRKQHRFEVLGS
ncbi:MAG: asparaginase domain-containing protein [Gammaproteobacteria bacterium]|nr:asparaginase domain-containing protein [Gammaproteobacteria bacterium]MDH3536997.1 asparaginase domain-containing protein [Gammaproteobacteria bacterium]